MGNSLSNLPLARRNKRATSERQPVPRRAIVAMAPRPDGVRTAKRGGSGLGSGAWGVIIRRARFSQSAIELAWYYALMLMRWLIDNYLRDAAQGKVRDGVSGLTRVARAGGGTVDLEPRKRGTWHRGQDAGS